MCYFLQLPVISCRGMYNSQQLNILRSVLSSATISTDRILLGKVETVLTKHLKLFGYFLSLKYKLIFIVLIHRG